MEEWWNPQTGTLIGAIGGSAIGVVGGTLGALAGVLAPRGKAKGFVIGSMFALIALGGSAAAAGGIAVATGQPYHVWYPLLLGGGILTVVMGPLLPVVFKRYAQAEARKLEAESFRRG